MPWMSIPIALAITGGATAGAQVYQARSAGKTNRRSLEASERSDVRASELEREALQAQLAESKRAQEAQLAEAKADRESKLQRDRERWQDYLRVNEPTWRAGNDMLGSLYDLAGYRGQGPAYAPPPSAPPPGTRSAPLPLGAPPGTPPSVEDSIRYSRVPGYREAGVPMRRRVAPPQIQAPMAPAPIDLSTLMQFAGVPAGDRIGRSIGS